MTMSTMIYEKYSGRVDAVRDMTADGVKLTAQQVVANVYGEGADEFFGTLPWFGPFPVGKKVVDGQVVADPDYVPPAPPAAPADPAV